MIREAITSDLEKIYEIGTHLHANYRDTTNLEKLLATGYFKLLVYQEKETIVGFLSYTEIEDTIDIVDIYVEENYRRQHIASYLLDYMITNTKKTTKILLDVAVDNEPALKLYDKFGFNVIHTRQKYYEQTDAYVMERSTK